MRAEHGSHALVMINDIYNKKIIELAGADNCAGEYTRHNGS